jgi:limonene-1,2-epoxide hydrolase
VASWSWRKGLQKKEIPNVSEQDNRDAVERYFQAFERQDLDAMEKLLHEDYVEEYPQSGERIRGKQNWRSVTENYPGLPNMTDHSYVLSGDLGVLKMTLEYDGNRIYACEIFDLEDGKIKRARAYFAEPFDAPDWRSQWVERM